MDGWMDMCLNIGMHEFNCSNKKLHSLIFKERQLESRQSIVFTYIHVAQ